MQKHDSSKGGGRWRTTSMIQLAYSSFPLDTTSSFPTFASAVYILSQFENRLTLLTKLFI